MLMGALSGCEGKEPEEETFLMSAAVCSRVASLDPAMNTDSRAEAVFYALYENLMRMEEIGMGQVVLVPGIAKEYKETKNYDGSVDYVFTLRSSARWADGTRVKAKDFSYAWRRLADPATESPNASLLSMVRGYDEVRETGDVGKLALKVEDDTTFRVTLKAPCSYFLSEVCTAVATMPLRSDILYDNADWATSADTPGNGPYQTSLWLKREYVQLRRSETYYDGKISGPDYLRFCFASDPQSAWQLYEDGRADYVSYPPSGVETTAVLPLRSTACVLYNHMSEAFSNSHVRRAFDLVLDRAAIAEGLGIPATGLVPHGILNASAEEERDFRDVGGPLCATDPEGYPARCMEAETELRTGGYWGGVGLSEVSCIFVSGEDTQTAASLCASAWQEKLKVTVRTEGLSREEFDERVAAGLYDVAVDMISTSGSDAMSYLEPFSGMDGNNALHYASRPYDLLIGVAENSLDPQARAAFLHDAEAMLLEETALSPLYFGSMPYVLREGLTGVRHDLRGNPSFARVTRIGTN